MAMQNPSRPAKREYLAVVSETDSAEDFDVRRVLAVLKRWRRVACAAFAGCVVLAVLYAVLSPKVYRAQIVSAVVSDASRGGGINLGGGALGGLASIAGLRVGGDIGKRAEILTVLRSQRFIEDFITENQLIPVLFANQWDAAAKTWNPDVEDPPNITDAFLKFSRSVLRVAEDTETGLVTIGIEWTDRQAVAVWVKSLVARLNAQLKEQAVKESTASLQFLEKKLEATQTIELRQAVYQLIEGQLNREMLAEANAEYALRTVAGAVTPAEELYVRPKRLFVVAAGTLAGMLLALFGAFFLEAILPARRSDARQ